MTKAKRIAALLLALLFAIPLAAFTPTAAAAEDTQPEPEHDTLALVPGFFCLHPHKHTPGYHDPYSGLDWDDAWGEMPDDYDELDHTGEQRYTAVPSTQYTGYSQDTLNKVAAVIILSQQFKDETGKGIDQDVQQQVIWNIVCTRPECANDIHLQGNDLMKEYHQYVLAHYQEVIGHYQMTIWVADNQDYQDILEAKRIIKHEVPSVEKKVLDHNDTNNAGDAAIGWQDSADYDIGDSIPFQITATLRDLEVFQSYYLEFVDTMEHMTLVENTLAITLDGKDVKDKFEITWDAAEKSLSLVCKDVLALGAQSGNEVVVTYNATLDADANIGHDGNTNEVYLIFSRSSGTADRGQTPSDKVRVFTYQITLNKTDEEGNALTGAAFELFKKIPGETAGEYRYVSVGLSGAKLEEGKYILLDDTNTTFLWQGLDDGTYKLVEVITPIGYNTMEPLEFTLTIWHEHNAEDPWIIETACDHPGFDSFNCDWAFYNEEAGLLEADVVNRAGTLLPSTGGMGTTMFYVFGSALLLTAACLLLHRRRETI